LVPLFTKSGGRFFTKKGQKGFLQKATNLKVYSTNSPRSVALLLAVIFTIT
jgi:hypothetical protein